MRKFLDISVPSNTDLNMGRVNLMKMARRTGGFNRYVCSGGMVMLTWRRNDLYAVLRNEPPSFDRNLEPLTPAPRESGSFKAGTERAAATFEVLRESAPHTLHVPATTQLRCLASIPQKGSKLNIHPSLITSTFFYVYFLFIAPVAPSARHLCSTLTLPWPLQHIGKRHHNGKQLGLRAKWPRR